jgi:hypothetical protein
VRDAGGDYEEGRGCYYKELKGVMGRVLGVG